MESYVTIMATGHDPKTRLSRIFEALHRDRIDAGCPLPVLPIENGIAVYGTTTALQLLLASSRTSMTAAAIGAVVSDVMPVPADAPHVVVRRARPDRHSPGEVARRDRRSAQRIAAGISKLTAEGIEARRVRLLERAAESRRPITFAVASSTTGQRVPFWIDVSPADAPVAGRFTSYGLSVDGATVPVV